MEELLEVACAGRSRRVGVLRHEASGLLLHLIPGGPHALGQAEPLDHEAPPREVVLQPFLIGRAPVRQEEWDRLGGDDRRPCAGLDLPISGVSWLAASAWLTRAGLRLPREDEWEAACRGGGREPWFFGPRFDPAWAWVLDNAGRRPQPVAAHAGRANAWGLLDLAGNVSEWCQEPLDAPLEGSSWQEGDPGRVHRGGSFDYPSRYARSSYRAGSAPDRAYPDLGLRAALSLPQ